MLNITSIKDPLIKAARLLNKPAERTNKFLLEGSDAIKWALDAEFFAQLNNKENKGLIAVLQNLTVGVKK